MSAAVQLDTLLVRTPGVCGGRLRIDGTRVTVNQIVTQYKRGDTPEEIVQHFPHLSLGQIYAALAYYHSNQAQVEKELADEQANGQIAVSRSRKRFRDLAAFGIWADRQEMADPVQFTTQLRRRMERGEESK